MFNIVVYVIIWRQVMVEEFIKMRDGFSLAVTKFDIENPVGVVQLVHGAKEHRKDIINFASS